MDICRSHRSFDDHDHSEKWFLVDSTITNPLPSHYTYTHHNIHFRWAINHIRLISELQLLKSSIPYSPLVHNNDSLESREHLYQFTWLHTLVIIIEYWFSSHTLFKTKHLITLTNDEHNLLKAIILMGRRTTSPPLDNHGWFIGNVTFTILQSEKLPWAHTELLTCTACHWTPLQEYRTK